MKLLIHLTLPFPNMVCSAFTWAATAPSEKGVAVVVELVARPLPLLAPMVTCPQKVALKYECHAITSTQPRGSSLFLLGLPLLNRSCSRVAVKESSFSVALGSR